MDDNNNGRKISMKEKIKQFLCFTCCFTTNRRAESSSSTTTKHPLFLIRSSSQWIKSRASVDLPEIKHKCRNLLGRIGNSTGKQNHRRRRSSADFSYDPLSYALNFEEETCRNDDDDFTIKNFAARLPSSPLPSCAFSDDDGTSLSVVV